jgi:hypothetical protein
MTCAIAEAICAFGEAASGRAPQCSVMARKKRTLIAVVFIVVWSLISMGAISYVAHSNGDEPCANPRPASAARVAGIGLPSHVTLCRDPSVLPLQFVAQKASVICRATGVTIDCPSMHREALAFTTAMAEAGWDNEKIDVSKDNDSATLSFRLPKAYATVMLRRSRSGEITGDLTLMR